MNWLVTGGCGFIGTALIRTLMQEGTHGVRVVDNLAVGTREDLAAASDFVEVSPQEPGPISQDGRVELLVGDIQDAGLALRARSSSSSATYRTRDWRCAPPRAPT